MRLGIWAWDSGSRLRVEDSGFMILGSGRENLGCLGC